MQAFSRALLLAVVATGLTACQYINEISTNIGLPFVGGTCEGKSQDKLRGVEWEKARVIEFRIRQGHFDPMLVKLSQDEPYVFRFVNRDEFEHVFRAPEFFSSIAIEKVSSSGKDIQQPCMIGVGIPPEKIVEVQFVADRDGRYEFEDSELGFPTLFSAGNGGIVYISLPRRQIQSPFNLQVVEPPAPVAPAAKAPAPSGFPVDPSLQAPGPGSLPGDAPTSLPGDAPVTLPGDKAVSLPGDAPGRLPGDAPVALPGDKAVSLPGDAPVRLPGDTPAALPGDKAVTLPGDAPVRLPGDAPAALPGDKALSLPGDAPVRLPGDAPAALPGDKAVTLPGDAPVRLPGDTPAALPGDKAVSLPGEVPAGQPVKKPAQTLPVDPLTSLPGEQPAGLPAKKNTEPAPITPVTDLRPKKTPKLPPGFPGLAPHEMPGAIMPDPFNGAPLDPPSDVTTGKRPAPAPASLPSNLSVN